MSKWFVEYTEEAAKDLEALDYSQQLYVLKAINKVAENPLPNSEGGLGKPLGNHLTGNLSGFLKIKLLKQGLRVVYRIVKDQEIMRIIIISVRDDDTVYRIAMTRLNK